MFSPSHPHTLPRTSSTDHYLPTFDLSLPVQITTNCAGFISCFSTLVWGWRDLTHSKATLLPGYEKDLPSGPGLSQELSSLHWEILDQQPLPNRTPGPQLWDIQPDKTTLPSGGLGEWPVDLMSIEEWGSHSLPGSQPTPFPKPTASSRAPPEASRCRKGTGSTSAWGQSVKSHPRSPILSKSALWISIHTPCLISVVFVFPGCFLE